MRYLAIACLLSLGWFTPARADILGANVQLPTGSGVVVYSEMHGSSPKTYVVTAEHVIDGVVLMKTFDGPEDRGKNREKHISLIFPIRWFRYESGHVVEVIERNAIVRAYDKQKDLAVVEILHRSSPMKDGSVESVSLAMPKALTLFDKVMSVGAGNGKRPLATEGIVQSLDGISDDPNRSTESYVMHSANIIYGFSGGGLYRQNRYTEEMELVGINVQVSLFRNFTASFPITWMALAVPIGDVRTFLDRNGFPYKN